MFKNFILGFMMLCLLLVQGLPQNKDKAGKERPVEEKERNVIEYHQEIYGKELSLEKNTPIPHILSDPENYKDQQVQVRGVVTDVCPRRGCWMNIQDQASQQIIQIKVRDGEIIFPKTAVGKVAVVEGTVEKLELSVEEARAWKKHVADEKGEEFDPESVSEPLIIWRIRGTGAKIEG